jgi:hypothetical protein
MPLIAVLYQTVTDRKISLMPKKHAQQKNDDKELFLTKKGWLHFQCM